MDIRVKMVLHGTYTDRRGEETTIVVPVAEVSSMQIDTENEPFSESRVAEIVRDALVATAQGLRTVEEPQQDEMDEKGET